MRAISSSALSVLALLRDWLSKELARSTRDGCRFEFWVGKRESRACSTGRLILSCVLIVVRQMNSWHLIE